MDMDDKILTVDQFAELIGVTRKIVLKLIHEGKILAFKLSDGPRGRYRIKKSEVERLISFELHKKYEEKK